MKCPVYFDGIYNRHLSAFENISVPLLLNKVAKFFYANLMNGDVVSTSKIKSIWDRYCKKYPDYITPQKCLDGLNLLMKLYQWAKKNELIIAGMSTSYRLFFHGSKIDIGYNGSIETVAMQKNGKLEILVTDFHNKMPDQYLLDMKLKFTLDSLGYSMTHGENIGVHIHHVNTDKDFFTFRGRDDIKRAKNVVENIAYCIHNKIFYPHENVFCVGCDMKHFCRGWNQEGEIYNAVGN